MNKIIITLLLGCLLTLSHSLVLAEIYEWNDADGSVHFSDSPTNLPKGKRPTVRKDETIVVPPSSNKNNPRSLKASEHGIVEVNKCFLKSDDAMKLVGEVAIDKKTGLMWASNGNIAGEKMMWQTAKEWVKNLSYGGYSDWRLPTRDELTDIGKRGGNRPYECLNSIGFKSFIGGGYWSSSEYNTDFVWSLSMNNSTEGYTHKAFINYVWPVRSTQ